MFLLWDNVCWTFFLFQALIEFIEWKGYKVSDHEIITNYPRRIISELDQESKIRAFEISNIKGHYVRVDNNLS